MADTDHADTDHADTDHAELGTLERDGTVGILRYRRLLRHPRAVVWRAMSEPDQLAGWFPTTIEGDHTPGSTLTFGFRGVEMDPMAGEMLAFEPPSLLELRWGDDTLRFELFEEGDETRLELTVRFPDYGKAARDGAGWHVCLDRLAHELGDDGTPSWEDDEGWRVIHPDYVRTFGPEASSIGPPREWEDVHGPA